MQNQLHEVLARFNQPWVDRLNELINTSIKSTRFLHIQVADSNNLRGSAKQVLENELNAVSIRTHMQLLQDQSTSEEGSNNYWEWASSPAGQEYFSREYPELTRIFDYKVSQLASLVESVLLRFDQDFPALEECGLKLGTQLEGLEVTTGDPHKGGQRVCILTTDQGRIVFKPRSMQIDSAVYQVAEMLAPSLDSVTRINVPRVLDRELYGWQEFIQYRPCRDTEELQNYYASLGSLTAFFAALGGHDFHYENVTVHEGQAVPLDLEAALGNAYHEQRLTGEDLATRIQRTASTAGSKTMLLPPLMRSQRFDIDLSPLTDGTAQRSATMCAPRLQWGESQQPEVRMEGSVVEKPHAFTDEVPSGRTHPQHYFGCFTLGFRNMTHAINKHVEVLIEFFAQAHSIPNRCILRPTSTYASFLDTSYHPNYLVSATSRQELLKRLGRPPGAPAPLGEPLSKIESESLLQGDIPYFTDTDLQYLANNRLPREQIQEELVGFQIAPIQALRSFAKSNPEAHRMVHRGVFASLDEDVWTQRDKPDLDSLFPLDFSESFNQTLGQLAEEVEGLLVWDADSRQCSILHHSVGESGRAVVIPLDFTYFDGQGVLQLFDSAWKATGSQRYLRGIRGLLQTCTEEMPTSSEGLQVSSYIHNFSRLQLLPLMKQHLGDQKAHDFAGATVQAARERLHEADHLETDYVTGLSGALSLLCAHSGEGIAGSDELREALVQRISDSLVLQPSRRKGAAGLAHGPIGPLLALAEAEVTPRGWSNDFLVEQARVIYQRESRNASQWSSQSRQAWCSGVPGVLLAYLRICEQAGKITSEERSQALQHFAQCREDILGLRHQVDFSLCHGVAGTLSAWQNIASILDDDELRRGIAELSHRLREKLSQGEITFGGGVRHGSSLLGYMLGATGALDALGRIENQIYAADLLSVAA